MYDIVFLILNYNSLDDLIACIKSIHTYSQDFLIVVVDNCSKPENVVALEKFCFKEKKIVLIKNNENVGFARGNNIGFRYIRQNLQCKYIAMINSDILFIEPFLNTKLDKAFDKYYFAVMGPDILPSFSNPMVNEPNTLDKVKREIKKIKRDLFFINIPMINVAYLALKKVMIKLSQNRKSKKFDHPVLNCELHGCCLFFSNLYDLDGLCDDTFLYGEEHILLKDCRDNNLTTLFYPDLKVIHNESHATKITMPSLIKRKKLFYENYLKSLLILLNKYKDRIYYI